MSGGGTIELAPIGVVRSPFADKRAAPRQGVVAGAEGTIELFAATGMADALSDLEGFERIFVLFCFHEAKGFRPKVQPPRSSVRRGVLATRSPHRPNPIGLSVVRLLGVDTSKLVLRVADLDMIDGTPVLDIKPYIPYADAFPASRAGWLDEEGGRVVAERGTHDKGGAPRDPIAPFEVRFSPEAERGLAWLAARGEDLRGALERALALGPAPHAYRRIRKKGDHLEIAVKDFRAAFVAHPEERALTVLRVYSGYSPRQLETLDTPAVALHRAFANAQAL